MKTKILLFVVLLLSLAAQAQNYKFGKVSKAELEEKLCPIDSSANAYILYSDRQTSFEYKEGKGFEIKDEYYIRIKIYNKEGFDIATKEIPEFFNSSQREKVQGIKGTTYNLVNGKIEKTKLSKKNIYKEKNSNHVNVYKFTMPNIKPGSVVEWKYTLYSPFITELDKVILQYDYPAKDVHAMIKIPEFFQYRNYQKGFIPINIQKSSSRQSLTFIQKTRTAGGWGPGETNYSHQMIDFNELVQEINMRNVPALKEEPYAGDMNNYRSSVLYELISIEFPNSVRKDYALIWEDVVKETYLSSEFGAQLKKQKYLTNDITPYLKMPNNYDKLKAVYELAKQKIKWNKEYGYYVEKGVKKAYKEGTGNVAEVNLNLINMLNAAGFYALLMLCRF